MFARSFVIFVVLLSGCAVLDSSIVPVAPLSNIAPKLYAPPIESEYLIQVGDRLGIASYYDPQLNQDITVRPDGRISLLLMGDVFVAGMTPTELDIQVTNAYKRVVDSPEVTVVVKEVNSMSIYLGGEVKNPATQALRGPLTVVQAITSAGGFLTSANTKEVIVLRKQLDGQFVAYKHNIGRVLTSEIPDIYLQRNDIIYVPKTTIANVGEFVDQFVNKLIPKSVLFNYGWVENRNATVQVVQ